MYYLISAETLAKSRASGKKLGPEDAALCDSTYRHVCYGMSEGDEIWNDGDFAAQKTPEDYLGEWLDSDMSRCAIVGKRSKREWFVRLCFDGGRTETGTGTSLDGATANAIAKTETTKA